MYIRPSKSVHPIYKKFTSDLFKLKVYTSNLQIVYIRPTKSVYPTYKKCTSDPYEKCTSDLQKLFIRPTNSVHLTYKKRLYRCLQNQLAPSTWLKLIRPVGQIKQKNVQPTYSCCRPDIAIGRKVSWSEVQYRGEDVAS